ncbi:hypothetical protein M501DRAFT_1010508 [Patellaria atrata CBS 101060]|uniref:Uncharacterized protein n=1 Tax=Patellaria atrata CBS 101060 TaxID=1346257 RepID=A0A9P4VP20_9PEZI|nr:hypothetical protein M501DRAFT_1010508 [Patellaria atrata CBS 101060]
MTAGLMRRVSLLNHSRAHAVKPYHKPEHFLIPVFYQPRRTLTNVRDSTLSSFSEVWFNSSIPCPNVVPLGIEGDGKPPDERTLKLGKTIRILHERLPTLLVSPLPQEILSPHITLNLFPSTHPHLPTVSGRIGYTAALWTAPVAWGRIPVVGNIKLIILSERLVRNGSSSTPSNLRHEKLIVRWKTCGRAKAKDSDVSSQAERLTDFLRGKEEEFHGLFYFEFDEEGRIATHTIEHAEEGGNWDRMTRVISVTDWLLGKAWGKKADDVPGFALGYCPAHEDDRRRRRGGDKDH